MKRDVPAMFFQTFWCCACNKPADEPEVTSHPVSSDNGHAQDSPGHVEPPSSVAAQPRNLEKMKARMEGDRLKVKEKPPVCVTISSVELLASSSSTSLEARKFSVDGLVARLLVGIAGSDDKVLQELGQEAALHCIRRVSLASIASPTTGELTGRATEGRPSGGAGVEKGNSLIPLKERKVHPTSERSSGAAVAPAERVVQVRVVFSISRDVDEDVAVNVTKMEFDIEGKLMQLSSPHILSDVRQALSDSVNNFMDSALQ